MHVPFNDLYEQYLTIKPEVDAALAAVIRESAYIKGPFVERFEREFAAWNESKHFVGCANGTDAIEMALESLEIGPGDEVLVPANTWISTAEAVTSVGATVVFVDNHPHLYTLDPSKIEAKITQRTKAIIAVHLYGLPAQMDELAALAKKHGLYLLEDCAQAHGARHRGRPVGTMGDAATFSFFPGKNLGAYGDAGGIACSDDALALRLRQLGNHGRTGKFDHAFQGRNSRLDGLQAAVLSAKLPHLKEWTRRRISLAEAYTERLRGLPGIQLPSTPAESTHVFHLYVIQVRDRERVREGLEQKGIHTGIQYPIALPFLAAFKHLEHTPEDFPNAYTAMGRLLSLPLYPEMTLDQLDHVCRCLKELL
ncbi:MAG: DegT/DnrJ/EryC1/StrS family aminotransferase [Myxococcales bacterium]|nr:DegT/DnrJ/EryC1/StrS family aminotransferase [Myxococcales bacterium]